MDCFFKNYTVLTNYVPTDIYPVQYGAQQCESGYLFGPHVRKNYIIHYVYRGKGKIKINNSEHDVYPGQIFLICPDQIAAYQADKDEPWLYRWIEFNGSFAAVISSIFKNERNSYIITDTTDRLIGEKFKLFVDEGNVSFERLMEKLWAFIGTLTAAFPDKQQPQTKDYAKIADEYIQNNIHEKLTVVDIAEHLNINRSYLSRLFKQYKNISLQQYIISTKMTTAAQFLKNTDMSVTEVANSVGYTDYNIFTKMFKQHFHLPPSVWRRKYTWEQYIFKT